MTIETCMELVDTLLPNSLSQEVKLRLLGELEGRVRVELLRQAPEEVPLFDGKTPGDTVLSAPYPFDQIYWMYLVAMICQINGDTARYENGAALFNTAYLNYGKWLKRREA